MGGSVIVIDSKAAWDAQLAKGKEEHKPVSQVVRSRANGPADLNTCS